ncbi:hypothetical protein GF339_06465, partial [candidate division KSB3 bacterium]|nr:hypothetical protein [candidate division KSB3 bacterium]MBD3324209.1 hypothetical protein [candidate division KSB3 bacterium]
YSDLLHNFLGWGEGLMLVNEPQVKEILAILEERFQTLIEELISLPVQIFLAPDNLDGQFISPRTFKKALAPGYRQTTDILHQHGTHLIVHVGGPIKHLLPHLADAGVDGIEGISGPPQSDASLAEARDLVGPDQTLWGGIPQDVLLPTHDEKAFESTVKRAIQEAQADTRMMLGIADRVPPNADLKRLETIPKLIQEALSRA